MARHDQREHPRIPCQIPIEYSLFSMTDSFSGTVLNISNGGAYIKTDRHLYPETSVKIWIIVDDENPFLKEYEASFNAEVRWFKKIDNAENPHFGIGVEFHKNSPRVFD